MSWDDLDPDFRQLCRRALTDRQLQVVKLKAAGYGMRRIGDILEIRRETAKDHWRAAQANIRQEAAARRGVQDRGIPLT